MERIILSLITNVSRKIIRHADNYDNEIVRNIGHLSITLKCSFSEYSVYSVGKSLLPVFYLRNKMSSE
jgi:hypothetical protein